MIYMCILTHLPYRANAKKNVIYQREIFSAMAESWKKLMTSDVFSSFFVC